MSRYSQIAKIQTSITREELKEHVGSGCSGVHESVLRSYSIVHEVVQLLKLAVPAEVILELIGIMQENPKPEAPQ